MQQLNGVEAPLVAKIQRIFRPSLDYPAVLLRWAVTDEGIALVLAVLCWMTTPQHAMVTMICVSANEILNAAIKWAVQRPRPFWLIDSGIVNVPGAFESDYSFPSSHAQISAGIVASLFWGEFGAPPVLIGLLLVLVSCMGLARVYLGVHFALDVLVGCGLGVAVPTVVQRLDIIDWFGGLLPNTRLGVALAPLVAYILLAAVRASVPGFDSKTIERWTNAFHVSEIRVSSKTLRVRSLERYDFPIWCAVGGIVAAAIGLRDPTFRYTWEVCSTADLSSTLPRAARGLAGLSLVAPLAFVVPKMLNPAADHARLSLRTSGWRIDAARLIKMLGSFLVPMWTLYGCPKISEPLGWHCPLVRLPQSAPVVETGTPGASACLFAPYPHRRSFLVDRVQEPRVVTSLTELQELIRNTTVERGDTSSGSSSIIRVIGAAHSQILTQAHATRTTVLYVNGLQMNRTQDAAASYCGAAIDTPSFFSDERKGPLPRFNQLLSSMLGSVLSQPGCASGSGLYHRIISSPVYQEALALARGSRRRTIFLERCLNELLRHNGSSSHAHGVDFSLYSLCVTGTTTAPYDILEGDYEARTSPYHHELPLDHHMDQGLLGIDLSEMFFPAEDDAAIVAIVESVLLDLLRSPGDNLPGSVYVELYAAPPSDAYLSPTHGKAALRVSLIASQVVGDTYAYFARFWKLYAGRGLSLHLGKHLPTGAGDAYLLCALRRSFGSNLPAFQDVISREDPAGIFIDSYWTCVLYDSVCDFDIND